MAVQIRALLLVLAPAQVTPIVMWVLIVTRLVRRMLPMVEAAMRILIALAVTVKMAFAAPVVIVARRREIVPALIARLPRVMTLLAARELGMTRPARRINAERMPISQTIARVALE